MSILHFVESITHTDYGEPTLCGINHGMYMYRRFVDEVFDSTNKQVVDVLNHAFAHSICAKCTEAVIRMWISPDGEHTDD